MIKINNVSRHYGTFVAVNNLSLTINSGEVIGLLGHNGAGKTTLLKMLTGYLEPTDGSIIVNGHNICEERRLIQQEIGYLPENCPLYPEMEVAPFLRHIANLHGLPEAEHGPYIASALALTELQDRAWQRIETLSRGLRQRVGVAQAILNKPRLLILDEPTNGLDPTQIKHMRSLIRHLAKSTTVIISTHILQEVQATCDRVIIIRNGCKALDARLDKLQQGRRLIFTTDATEEQLATILSTFPDSQRLANNHAGHSQYVISFDSHDHAEKQAPELAKLLIEAKQRLFSLQIEAPSLETIFGEISAGITGEQA